MNIMPEKHSGTRERGRPREFDRETALDLAMLVFREKGYHGASVSDLSAAMQLTVGSIYKAFHDKRGLFLQVFARYTSLRNKALSERLAHQPDGRAKIAELLRFYLESASGIEGRRGCLVVGSAVELQHLDAELSALVQAALTRNLHSLQHLIEQGRQDGSVNPRHDANALSGVLLCLVLGMRVAGKTGELPAHEQLIATALTLLG
ncbi:TetR/AcrR family transcriptional regulator [Chimaeribacter arupi]|uniref:TetR/AcrR family transcriptional regulator n=3 Tax=Enterobacterales TaxID=91347 RepID=A0A2N5ENF9_9GAMM|nr:MULTISPECIES: TetR/AcrR family transcriptional regulator [Yersiniaceae]MBS0969462.1 TetR/AcrR family transcriptional regulator [Nissabacter archeti]PLR30122.1 TetR/AcrR family transcriptional regulator [Chimaeribacter arupi]PLR47553.1 TetR/AcrR family transcriptional regulator [Chimaeribacter arupi]PLR50223.1 TetR/AcrR family transcriptional regulator [Chimaeribacter arupi]WKZ94856.1 TetR/AcrR family transcriptional regulator [Chimaeribacter arupi]